MCLLNWLEVLKDAYNFIHVCDRLLRRQVAPLFERRGLHFDEYIKSVRNWSDTLPPFSTMFGAYKKRSLEDEKIAPHSFTFLCRESHSDKQVVQ